jgi:hypothetical protein
VLVTLAVTLASCSGSHPARAHRHAAAPTHPPTTAVPVHHPTIPADAFGMSVVGSPTWPLVPVGSYRTWDSGITWASVQPSPGRFDWSTADTRVDAARGHGAQVLYVLGPTPQWASTQPTRPDYQTFPPRSMTDWTAYVAAVVQHFRGRVGAYEIWDEPNIGTFWHGTPAEMAAMTRAAAAIIRRLDPAALVVSPGLDARLSNGHAAGRWLRRYLAAGAAGHVQVIAVHLYPPWGGSPERATQLLAPVRATLASFGLSRLPVWDTEIGYGRDLPGSAPIIYTGSTAAAFVLQTYLLAEQAGIARTYWYAYGPHQVVGLFLTTDTGQLAAGGVGYRTAYHWLVGAVFDGCHAGAGVYTCRLGYRGATGLAMWSLGDRRTVTAPTGSVCLRNWADAVSRVRAGERVTVGAPPVLVVAGRGCAG